MSRPTNNNVEEMNKKLRAELRAAQNDCRPVEFSPNSLRIIVDVSSAGPGKVGRSSTGPIDGCHDVTHGDVESSVDRLAKSFNAIELDMYGEPVQPRSPSQSGRRVSPVSDDSTFVRKGAQESSNDPFKSSPAKAATADGSSGYDKSTSSMVPTTNKLVGTNDSTPSNTSKALAPKGLGGMDSSTPSNNRKARMNARQTWNGTPTSQPKNSRTSQNWRVGNTTSSTNSGGSGHSAINSGDGTPVQKDDAPPSLMSEVAIKIKQAKVAEMMKLAEISNTNAQAVYPPSSCVFVANLAQGESEEELQRGVTDVFRAYGPVFVKIRRDPKNMPFAFCQYTCDGDADQAIREGKGSIIHGRACRVERVKAHRTFMLSSRFGGDMTKELAFELLHEFGEIERAWMPSDTEIEMYDLPRGVFVSFVLYEAGRDALNAFKESDEFKLEIVKPIMSPSFLRSGPLAQHPVRNYIDKYEVDHRSIFVGNLPQEFTERQVYDLFCPYGPIIDIQLHRRQSIRDGFQWNVFAFVEFHDHVSVGRSIVAKHNTLVDGCYIRVSTKNSDHNRQDRRSHYDDRSTQRRTPGRVVEYAPATPQYGAPYGISPPYYQSPMYTGGYPGYSHAQYCLPPPPQWNGPATRPVGFEHSSATSGPAPFYPGYSYSPTPAEYHAHMAHMYYQQWYPTHPYGFSPPYSEPQAADSMVAQDGDNAPTLASNLDSFAHVQADASTQ